MNLHTKQSELVARGEDLQNLLEHIAWTDTIKPEIDKARAGYEKALTASVLGQKVVTQTPLGPVPISSEQIAARIEGLNFIEGVFAKVLAEGKKAFKDLQKLQLAE